MMKKSMNFCNKFMKINRKNFSFLLHEYQAIELLNKFNVSTGRVSKF